MVDPAEVGHDHRNGKCDDQHAAERADGAEDFSSDGVWNHVSIPVTNVNISQPQRDGLCEVRERETS